MTDVYRTIAGVRTVAVFDYELDAAGAQASIDYLAEDKVGNDWSLGGHTEEYGGRPVASALARHGAVDVALRTASRLASWTIAPASRRAAPADSLPAGSSTTNAVDRGST